MFTKFLLIIVTESGGIEYGLLPLSNCIPSHKYLKISSDNSGCLKTNNNLINKATNIIKVEDHFI